MEVSRKAISHVHATASQRKLIFGTGRTGEARSAAAEASEARAAKTISNARRSLIDRLIHRTAVYGPVRTVVWEGRSRETPPYPDPKLR